MSEPHKVSEPSDLDLYRENQRLREENYILATGNLKVQHWAAKTNQTLRKALESCRPFFEDDYMAGVISNALNDISIKNPEYFTWHPYPETSPKIDEAEDYCGAFFVSNRVLFYESKFRVIYVGRLKTYEDNENQAQWEMAGPDGYDIENVTHWMFLPDSPGEGEGMIQKLKEDIDKSGAKKKKKYVAIYNHRYGVDLLGFTTTREMGDLEADDVAKALKLNWEPKREEHMDFLHFSDIQFEDIDD